MVFQPALSSFPLPQLHGSPENQPLSKTIKNSSLEATTRDYCKRNDKGIEIVHLKTANTEEGSDRGMQEQQSIRHKKQKQNKT